MKIPKSLAKQMKNYSSPEELKKLAKKAGVNMSDEYINNLSEGLKKFNTISKDELKNVSKDDLKDLKDKYKEELKEIDK